MINLMSILGLVLLYTEMFLISMQKGKEILKLIKNNDQHINILVDNNIITVIPCLT